MKIDGLLREIRKNTGSTSFNESKFGRIDSYIDTGILALNRIISGDIYLGIPAGKVIMINGESQCTPKDQKVKILVKKFN